MNRRQFLATTTTTAIAATAGSTGALAGRGAQETRPFALDSPPVLQNPTPDGITVAWAVTGPATGWVEYGPTADLGLRARPATCGLRAYEERFLSVRLNGLTPGAVVHYRVVSAPIDFAGPYDIKQGEPVAGKIYRYTPPSPAAETAAFAVINDTHEKEPTMAALTEALEAESPDFTIWNGDVFDDVNSDDQVVQCVLRPAGAAYAAKRPVLFVPGNHDHRGREARGLSRAFTLWPDEPLVPRCFAVRHGPLAMIGLDTGEDKPDHHPAWSGLAAFEPYREAQRDWLEKTLQRPEIAAAPHLVVFCHIPLHGLPGENGADTLEGYGSWQKHARHLWHDLLAQAGVQTVISGHTHEHRYDEPTPDRPWGQLVGGGPQLDRATLIRGVADAGKLVIVTTNLKGEELSRWEFKARAV